MTMQAPPKDTTLREALIIRLDEVGWSRQELARQADISAADLSRFLNGKKGASDITLDRMAAAMGGWLAVLRCIRE